MSVSKGHEDAFYNNTCILFASFDQKYGHDVFPVMHDNKVYTCAGAAT